MFPLVHNKEVSLRDITEYIPPFVVSGGLFLGMNIAEWIQVMTLVYVIVGTACAVKRTFFSNNKGE